MECSRILSCRPYRSHAHRRLPDFPLVGTRCALRLPVLRAVIKTCRSFVMTAKESEPAIPRQIARPNVKRDLVTGSARDSIRVLNVGPHSREREKRQLAR